MTSKLALLHSILAATNVAPGYLAVEPTDDAKALQGEGLIEVNGSVAGLPVNHAAARVTPAGITFAQSNPLPQENQTQADNGGNWGGSQAGNAPTNFGDAAAQANQTQTTQATGQTSAPAGDKAPKFISVSGVGFTPSAPAKREGVKRTASETYPFGELKAPQRVGTNPDGSPQISYEGATVFVPSTKDKTGKLRTGDEMAFSLLSACNAAQRRYGKELPPKVGSDGKSRKQYEFGPEFGTQAGTGPNGEVGAFIYRKYKAEGAQA